MSPLILKRGDPSRRREDDYDVLENGVVVGRIFRVPAAAPEGRPWRWASGHGGHHIERAAHGYAGDPRGSDGSVREVMATAMIILDEISAYRAKSSARCYRAG